MLEATGDTGGETTGALSTNGVIYVSEDQPNFYDKFSPKVSLII